jgi:hypothetical protein
MAQYPLQMCLFWSVTVLFNEYQEDVEVFQRIAPPDGWGDFTWEMVGTVKGRFEPIDGSENFLQQQVFADVTEIFLSDYVNIHNVKSDYILKDADGILRRIVGEPERWKWGLINSHLAAKCRRAQWEE